jgi:hypothetical protein
MAPAPKPLDPSKLRYIFRFEYDPNTLCIVFELDAQSGKIRCRECFEADPIKTNWITRGSAKRHPETDEHLANIANNIERRAAEEMQRSRLHATYSTLAYAEFNSGVPNLAPSSRPGLFDSNDSLPELICEPEGDDDVDDDNDFFSPLDNYIIPADMAPLENDPSAEREKLRREVELMMMEAERIDDLGAAEFDDDVTVTNVMNEMRGLGIGNTICDVSFLTNIPDLNTDADEAPEDDHLAESRFDGDYAPYPNKVVRDIPFCTPKPYNHICRPCCLIYSTTYLAFACRVANSR